MRLDANSGTKLLGVFMKKTIPKNSLVGPEPEEKMKKKLYIT